MKNRLFIGFKVSRKIINVIDMVRSTLIDKERYYNWLSGNNLHITLLFLDSQNSQDIDEISSSIQKVSEEFNDFNIRVSGTGSFSKNHNNEVLWLGIEQDKNELDRINYELKNELEKFIIDSRKTSKFFPHITVARKRNFFLNNKIDVKSFMNSVYFPMEFHVKYFTLFQSIPTEKGVRYVKIKNFPLL